jgi:hypothetical protein
VRGHAKALSAESTPRQVAGLSLVAVLTALACLLVGAVSAMPAWALDTCPNVVFRTGPSAKLPECRAYELVSPPDMEGLPPSSSNLLNLFSSFPHATITPSGESLYFQTQGGALGQSPGTGTADRYRVTRTPQGWVTSFEGITGAQAQKGVSYGGASPDLAYYPVEVGNTRDSAELQSGAYLHTSNGLEVLAKGSLGEFLGSSDSTLENNSSATQAFLVTNGGQHVVFYTPRKLEPNAPGEGINTIYDRSVGGPTHVVSLLPGNVTPSSKAELAGVSPDGRDVVFETSEHQFPQPRYVRHDNTTTYEVVRPGGVVVGKKLSCNGGPGSATLTYEWLRNGGPIGGATSSTYTTTSADEGKTVQCQVSASNADGAAIGTSAAEVVEPYEGKNPAIPGNSSGNANGASVSGTPTVGQLLTCTDGGQWKGSPTFTYQWLRNGTEIPAATNTTYTTVAADKGKAIQCRVKGTNADGAALAYSFPMLIGGVVATASANPAISNVTDPGNPPASGDGLSCSSGTWTNSPSFAYQWLGNGTAIGGATSATYTVAAAEEEKTLQCLVTATTADASTQAVSDRLVVDPQPATTPPQQSFPGEVWGSATVGGTLHCEEGGWSGSPTITRQWLRNGAEIPGATENSYTLTASDLETVVQCRLTATNAGGATAAINAGSFGARYVQVEPPQAGATIPDVKLYFVGAYGGRVFYLEQPAAAPEFRDPGDLYSYDIATQRTAMIGPDTQDSYFSHISADGSHVYFLSQTEVNGEGEAGKPNLYVWRAADQSTELVATLGAQDPATNEYLDLSPTAIGEKSPGLTSWLRGQQLRSRYASFTGPSESHPESSSDGSVLLFTARSQLTSFDNTEAAPGDCQDPTEGGERCNEIYRYDSNTGEITCVSCPPGPGPAHGDARLHFVFGGDEFNFAKPGLLDNVTTIQNMTDDTETVFFETKAGLAPSDGNARLDVYRWNKQSGLALISSGQGTSDSLLYGVSQNGSDVVFATEQTLVAGDENGSVRRLYDARVGGGFPPPEGTVTEPCNGDACQGQSSAAPQPPNTASSALNGGGNVKQLRCPKGRRKVTRNGKEACARKHHRKARKHHRRRAGSNGRTGR